MGRILSTADGKLDPEGFSSQPAVACLQTIAGMAVTMSATVFAVLTDADAWVGGTILATPSAALGGFIIDEAAGTVKLNRAMNVRVKYFISGITVINGAVREAAVFAGSAGTTRKGGTGFGTDLTAGPSTLAGEVVFAGVAGDLISVKAIDSTAGTMTIAATGMSLIVEEV